MVVNARATARHRPLLERINAGLPHFANGGMIGGGSASASSAGGAPTLIQNIYVDNPTGDAGIAEAVPATSDARRRWSAVEAGLVTDDSTSFMPVAKHFGDGFADFAPDGSIDHDSRGRPGRSHSRGCTALSGGGDVGVKQLRPCPGGVVDFSHRAYCPPLSSPAPARPRAGPASAVGDGPVPDGEPGVGRL